MKPMHQEKMIDPTFCSDKRKTESFKFTELSVHCPDNSLSPSFIKVIVWRLELISENYILQS